MDKELHLPLKANWYRMIKSGEKPEEYREISEHWAKRLLGCYKECANAAKDGRCCVNCEAAHVHMNWRCKGQRIGPYTHVRFSLGYPRKDDAERNMRRKIKDVVIGEGNPQWGAQPGKVYFVIKLD